MEIERCNEINLIQQTLAGKTSAFDQLVRMYRSTIYVLVLSYIKNPADAEDLTQRIFIRAYERLATLRELDCFLAWLQQIAHNTCKDWLRRRSELATSIDAVKDADFSETAPSAEDIVLKAEVENIVRKAIDGLKETDRKLMEAHFIEGASYDELRAGSGLSYAAIANRLKRAKREVRRRVRKLLGGVAILPGRTFILGGIETVKLSAKVKFATAALATVIGVGGGGALYHHTVQLEPIVANNQKAPEERIAVVDSSTDISSTTYAGAAGSSSTNETSVSQTSQIDRFEITRDDGVKTVEVRYMSELPDALTEEIGALVHNLAENPYHVGDDSKESDDMTFDDIVSVGDIVIIQTESEEGLEDFPEVINQTVTIPGMDTLDGSLDNQRLEELIKKRWPSADVRVLRNEDLPEPLKQKIERIARAAIDKVNVHLHPTSIESQSQSTVPTPAAESTAVVYESSEQITPLLDEEWIDFERLLNGEFSDEEWAYLEKLLDSTTGRTTPRGNMQAPLNAERQQNIERILEDPPAIPSVGQEHWRQQRDLPESNSDVSPYPTTEDWHRTTK